MSETKKRKAAAKKPAVKKAAATKKAPAKQHPKEQRRVEATEPKEIKVKIQPPPMARVLSRHAVGPGEMKERDARGYSFGELDSAGISPGQARSLKVPLDLRRRSVLERNVTVLKGLERPQAKPKSPEVSPVQAPKPAKKTKAARPKKK